MRAFLPLLTGVAALVLAAPAPARAADSSHRHDRSWSAGWAIAGRPDIHLVTDDAHVRVHPRAGDSVLVRVRSGGRATGVIFGRRDPRVSLGAEGRRVDIEVRGGSTSGILVMTENQVVVDVWAPPQSDLQVRSGDGRVDLDGLAGRIDVETGDGSIRAANLAGIVGLRSGDGRITADRVQGSLMVDTRDGGIQVRGRFAGLGVQSGDGRLDVTVEPGSKLSEGGSIESGDGQVTVRLPRDIRLSIDARTDDGSLRVDMPATVHQIGGRHAITGDLNGGGPLLRVRSRDGGVRIEAL